MRFQKMTKNKTPFLSIIIPVYNSDAYLRECLTSIFKVPDTVLDDFEVIIIDDGSTDNSHNIYENFHKKYNNLSIIRTDNLGVSHARNQGISTAAGKYITFVDSDDILLDAWYKTLLAQKDTNVDIAFYSKDFRNTSPKSKDILYSYILTYNNENIRISGPYSKLFRTNFLKENNIRFMEDLINGEDMLFNLHATCHSKSFLLLKESFYAVRHNNKSATNSFNQEIFTSEQKFHNYFKNFVQELGVENIDKYKTLMYNNTIRTICYRISNINHYNTTKTEYKKLRNMFISRAKYNNKYCILLKLRLYMLLYIICRRKLHNNNTLEIL